jgi:hypothetical protein
MLSRAASVLVEPLQRQQNAARKLGFWVRIPPGARVLVSSERCVFAGTSVLVGRWSVIQRSLTECGVSIAVDRGAT